MILDLLRRIPGRILIRVCSWCRGYQGIKFGKYNGKLIEETGGTCRVCAAELISQIREVA